MKSDYSRRDFLRISAQTTVSAALASALGCYQRVTAATADTSGYKALVCLYLTGGNDGFNTIVPLTQAGYSLYAQTRTSLALDSNSLLPLNGTASDGYVYGMHPSAPELQSLFNSGKAAVLSNVGTLVQPTTPAQFQAGATPLPPQLFSHGDQATQWQTSIANSPHKYGWAGRLADMYAAQGITPNLGLNIQVGGPNYWQLGAATHTYTLGTGGAPVMVDTTSSYRNGLRAKAAAALLSQGSNDPNLLVGQFSGIQNSAASKVDYVNNAYAIAGDVTTPFPAYEQDSDLGAQFHSVARMIKARSQIGDARQMFFVNANGFDTHQNQLSTQSMLLRVISRNIQSFWSALGELGMQDNVTLFTASDFGRSLGSNGSGADHAWGNHQLILGGAVKGGKYYGKMPTLKIGGPDDLSPNSGQLIPTTSTDQYSATLAAWFGVAASDLPTLFPNLNNFSTPTLGFV
jgi:uncharacterized protein (DUF1501 family)